jgi:hypothetical protein
VEYLWAWMALFTKLRANRPTHVSANTLTAMFLLAGLS